MFKCCGELFEFEDLKKEFKVKSNSKGRKVKLNDFVKIKMLVTSGNEVIQNSQPN